MQRTHREFYLSNFIINSTGEFDEGHYKISDYWHPRMHISFKEYEKKCKEIDDYYLACPVYDEDGKFNVQIGGTGTIRKDEDLYDGFIRESIEELSISPYNFDDAQKSSFTSKKGHSSEWITLSTDYFKVIEDPISILKRKIVSEIDDRHNKCGFMYWQTENFWLSPKNVLIPESVIPQYNENSDNIIDVFFVSYDDIKSIIDRFYS